MLIDFIWMLVSVAFWFSVPWLACGAAVILGQILCDCKH
jgi:uncharacterized membrane protein